MARADDEQPVFYYDLGSPACYAAAELIMADFPVVPEWVPVLGRELGVADYESERALLERLVSERGLQPVRWPPLVATDAREAMLAATYAQHIGRGVSFSIACFRQVFAGGRDVGDPDTMLIAAAACEMHPAAVLKGVQLRSVREGLVDAGVRAREAGLTVLPALSIDGRLFEGAPAIAAGVQELGVRQ